MTHGASGRGHVSDDWTRGSDGFPLSNCERTRVQVSGPVVINDATSKLVVTLLGIFPLLDKLVALSFLVVYIWKDCVDFFLDLVKLLLKGCHR
jgi:hypothetical protein